MPELVDRIRRLEHLDEIRRLQFAYRSALDNRDFAGYAALFAPDGEWIRRSGAERGPAAIQEMLERTQHHAVGDNFHIVANQVIILDGDAATAESTFVVISRGAGDRPVLRVVGTYLDELIRKPDGWRFARRTARGEMSTGHANG